MRTSLLDSLTIASPCHERWESMVGDDEKRHCARCDLDVFNLTSMTREEAAALILEAEHGRVCVRLFRRADGTVLTRDCPVGVKAKRRLPLVAAAMAGIAGVAAMTASAAGVAMSMTADGASSDDTHARRPHTIHRDPQAKPIALTETGAAIVDAVTHPFGAIDEVAIARAQAEKKQREIEAAKAEEARLRAEGAGMAIAGGIRPMPPTGVKMGKVAPAAGGF